MTIRQDELRRIVRRAATRAGVLFLASLAAGCVMDPEIGGADLALEGSVDGVLWRAAPAGCEDVSPIGLVLVACDGEAALGALVDDQGRVRCVDALARLARPVLHRVSVDPRAGDPSPQPNRPPPPERLWTSR